MPVDGLNETDSAQKAEAERAAEEAAEDLKWLMHDKRGRRFMWRLLSETSVFQQTFMPGAPDVSAFREGQRSVGLMLTARVTLHCPERMSEMQTEARANATRRSTSRK